MKSFLLLLKVQVLGLFGLNRVLHTKPGKALVGMVLAGVAIAILCAVVVLYVVMLSLGLVTMGATEVVPLLVIEVGALAGACAAFPKAGGLLFSFRDYDLVMALPIARPVVVLSRIASLYAMAVVLNALIVTPALVVLACVGAVGVGLGELILVGVLVVLLAPIIPLAVSVALAALVAVVSTRFRRAGVAMGVLGMLLVVGIVIGSFALRGMGADPAHAGVVGLAAEQAAALSGALGAYAPARWAAAAVMKGDAGALLLFVVVSLAVAVALVAVLVRVFVPVNEALMSSRPHAAFSFEDVVARGHAKGPRVRRPLWALVGKEARLLVTTPAYLLNTCIGYVLALVAGVAAVIGRLTGALDGMLPPELVPLVADVAPWALAFCLGIASPTTASVSLEGSARWLVQSTPLSSATVLGSKMALGILLSVPTALVGGALCALALGVDALQAVAMIVAPLASGVLAVSVGLTLDSLRPRFDWTTPYEPVKRGFSVIVTMAVGMVAAMAGFFAASVLGWVGTLAVAVVELAVAAGAFCLANRRPLMRWE